MSNIMKFQEAIERTRGKDRSLLIGNGFSAQYFSYRSLLEKSDIVENSPVEKLFRKLNTVDFEAVVRALEDAVIVERAYGYDEHASRLERDAQAVREALVKAVRETHPKYSNELTFQYEPATRFLKNFSKVFSLNYDLLLYWVGLQNGHLKDGFGRGRSKNGGRFHGPFQEIAHCNTFNVHGGLHLFLDEAGDTIKALNKGKGVLETIADEIILKKKFPLYVAEGTSESKMRKIKSVEYLRHCYQKLETNNDEIIFIYGHSAAENDEHIYKAIFKSGVIQLYFGIYDRDEDSIAEIRGNLSKYREKYGETVIIEFFDSRTACIWDETAI